MTDQIRKNGSHVTITVDGEPAAELTEQEAATARALLGSTIRLAKVSEPFDAVALVGEGRR